MRVYEAEETEEGRSGHDRRVRLPPASSNGGDSEQELARFADAKIDVHALSRQLQDEGAKSFVKSWNDLIGVISSKSAVLKQAS